MPDLRLASPAELADRRAALQARHAEVRARGLALDMTRGKPAANQLDLSDALLGWPAGVAPRSAEGVDARNYGDLQGLPAMRAIFAEVLDVPASQVIVGGNSSLTLMHDQLVRALLHGVPGGQGPWRAGPVKFLCPVPGYDRHFAICQHFGVEMVPVQLDGRGPDMDAVEALVAADPAIRGMWCVPKYSNPTGVTYADDVVRRLAAMPTAAPDFRLWWDNAYAEHHLGGDGEPLLEILAACAAAGHPDRAYVFTSTSKITYAGAGVACMASSPTNVADVLRHLTIQTIGPDKVNQLRHVQLLGDAAGLRTHMQRHAAILRPKFEAVDRLFTAHLGGLEIASWTRPRGGYFVSLDVLAGTAKATVALAAAAGVKLTAAGATFPGGVDPDDRNLRIAPSLPPLHEVETAMEVVALCVELAAVEALLARAS
jgi:aspartate/methionine/tyrosine aminotransferase